MSDEILRLREARADLIARAKATIDEARQDNRPLSYTEQTQLEDAVARAAVMEEDITDAENERESKLSKAVARSAFTGGGENTMNGTPGKHYELWRDARTGKDVYAVRAGGRLADLYRGDTPKLSFGKWLQWRVTGRPEFAAREIEFLATDQATNNNYLGGFLVPEILSADVIDKARALSVVQQAGCLTVPMLAPDVSIAKVETDPAHQIKGENVAFAGSNIVFGAVSMHAWTAGTLITASRELAQDAPNWPSVVENTLARSLAAQLDQWALRGSGSAEPLGIRNNPDVHAASAVGAVADYDDIIAAIELIETDNHMCRTIICHPDVTGAYRALKTGDGTNAAKAYMQPPDVVRNLQWLSSTNATSGEAVLGDFSKSLWGVRMEAEIQFSETAGDAFSKNQVLVRIIFRGDFAVADPTAFEVLPGIS